MSHQRICLLKINSTVVWRERKVSENPFTWEMCEDTHISWLWLLCSLSSFTQVCDLSRLFLMSKIHWKANSPCYTNDSLFLQETFLSLEELFSFFKLCESALPLLFMCISQEIDCWCFRICYSPTFGIHCTCHIFSSEIPLYSLFIIFTYIIVMVRIEFFIFFCIILPWSRMTLKGWSQNFKRWKDNIAPTRPPAEMLREKKKHKRLCYPGREGRRCAALLQLRLWTTKAESPAANVKWSTGAGGQSLSIYCLALPLKQGEN